MTSRRPRSSSSYVYVVADGAGQLKVGVAAEPRRRLRQLQVGNARRLSLRRFVPFQGDDPEAVERYAHWLLRDHHVGGEWFVVDEKTAVVALLGAAMAVIKGLRAPRPGFGGRGRDKLWEERLNVTLPKGAKDQIVAALREDEDSLDFARTALSAELQKRGHDALPDPKTDQALRPKRKPD